MNTEQYYLLKLAEEATEVAHIVMKSMQFGLDEVHPKLGISNRARIHEELNDLEASISLCNENTDLKYRTSLRAVIKKKEKVERYLEISKRNGLVK